MKCPWASWSHLLPWIVQASCAELGSGERMGGCAKQAGRWKTAFGLMIKEPH